MEIEIDSQNESQLNRIKKYPFSLIQKDSLAKKVKKYPFLLDESKKKTYKEKDISQKFSLSKTLALFARFDYFFQVLKTKNNIISNSLVPILM